MQFWVNCIFLWTFEARNLVHRDVYGAGGFWCTYGTWMWMHILFLFSFYFFFFSSLMQWDVNPFPFGRWPGLAWWEPSELLGSIRRKRVWEAQGLGGTSGACVWAHWKCWLVFLSPFEQQTEAVKVLCVLRSEQTSAIHRWKGKTPFRKDPNSISRNNLRSPSNGLQNKQGAMELFTPGSGELLVQP